ncbi:DegV family protein [Cohnella thailandensis]|uniref:DegV family protein n=1 Tax=Cohnella thailandensis TaxID=557557 RepID=A0A841T1W9_9BACL|nr:DegV family protein [Cohnella thailandensis]MBB6636575.1 DegV family protein [Cohnella thailandensis]MBP1973552.1 DegV family protein with EDD domain [Cohnella thailandensis]
MGAIALVTDSTSDIPREVRERLGIEMIPLTVHFGDEAYLDNVNLQPVEFYEKLQSFQGLPKSSQPSPADFLAVFERLIAEGKQVISINLSSALSGTYQSALLARSMLEDESPVTVIDSKSASYGYGMLVVKAAELAEQGASREEIIEAVTRLKESTKLYFLVDTLEYLHKGGRIGRASALFGSLLNIKPILTIDSEGYVNALDKARGQKRAFARIVELLEADFAGGPVDLNVVVTPGRTEMAEELIALLKERFPIRNYLQSAIGPVIGTHAGPGTVGIFMSPAVTE